MIRTAGCAAALLLAVFCAPALAHSGHGTGAGFAAGFTHPFLGLDHLLALAAAGIWAAQLGGRALWAIPLSFTLAMAVGSVFAFTGFTAPHIEPMIAASILGLGLLVSADAKTGAPASILLISVFAFWHGLAHGAEAPDQNIRIVYALGFLAASTVVQALGMTVAVWLRANARLAGIPIALAGGWILAGAFS